MSPCWCDMLAKLKPTKWGFRIWFTSSFSFEKKMKTTAAAHPALFEDEGVESRSYEDGSCIETSSGNKVSRQSVLCGTSNIRLHGKVSFETMIEALRMPVAAAPHAAPRALPGVSFPSALVLSASYVFFTLNVPGTWFSFLRPPPPSSALLLLPHPRTRPSSTEVRSSGET